MFYNYNKKESMDLKNFFEPKSVAIVGASRHPRKIGNIILRNFFETRYPGKVFAINPNSEEILGQKTLPSIKDIDGPVDLAVIVTPAETVYEILEQCASKKIKDIIIVSAGFSEVGNVKLEDKLKDFIRKKNLNVVGVNCLGIFDAYSNLDTLFNPRERMDRPKRGGISFICQSGAVGAIMIDKMAQENYGLRRFISYGNATGLDESDFIEYLGKDDKTKVICLYIEGVRDGAKFLEICKKVSKKKPIIALKAGITEKGTQAVKSHTGSLAGSGEVYKGVFKQAKIIQANTLEELFDYARILERGKPPKGNRVQIITNGGGPAVIMVDEMSGKNLELAEFEKHTAEKLRKEMPLTVNISNPLDLLGDANDERYKISIEAALADKNVDIIMVILLPQTPAISINIIKIMRNLHENSNKPICLIVPGGSFSDTIRKELEEYLPSFGFPINAVSAVSGLVKYYAEIDTTKSSRKKSTQK